MDDPADMAVEAANVLADRFGMPRVGHVGECTPALLTTLLSGILGTEPPGCPWTAPGTPPLEVARGLLHYLADEVVRLGTQGAVPACLSLTAIQRGQRHTLFLGTPFRCSLSDHLHLSGVALRRCRSVTHCRGGPRGV